MHKPNQPQMPYPTMPEPVPAPKRKRRIFRKGVMIPAAALLVGLVFGSAAAGSSEPAAAPAPEVKTVTKTVEVPVEKIVTKTVNVPTTPQSCLTALDLADEAFGYASDSIDILSGALQSAAVFDVDSINQATEDLTATNAKMATITDPITKAKADCRASK